MGNLENTSIRFSLSPQQTESKTHAVLLNLFLQHCLQKELFPHMKKALCAKKYNIQIQHNKKNYTFNLYVCDC